MDPVKKQINSWYLKFRQYIFKYSDGFYEFPFLANSPQVMVQSFDKMFFSKYDRKRNLLSSNNPFLHSELIHLELDEELILFLSKSVFKKNIKFKYLQDKNIPGNYFFLSYQITQRENENSTTLFNGIPYSVNNWLFYKPGCSPDNYYFKNTGGKFFTIFFTETWLKKWLQQCEPLKKMAIGHFLSSPQEFLIYPDDRENINYPLFQETINEQPLITEIDIRDFKELTYQILTDFLDCLEVGNVNEGFFQLSISERLKIIQAEKYLRKHFISEFPGIEQTANKVGITQTSLKTGFRLVYGKPVYKYFQAGKMQVAAQRLVENPQMKIAQLAHELGYENAGKFAAVFKENMGISPSEYSGKLKI